MIELKRSKTLLCVIAMTSVLSACVSTSNDNDSASFTSTDSSTDTDTDTTASTGDDCVKELPTAYTEFASHVDVVLSEDGCSVTLESNGQPDHTSPYWDPDGMSGLWVAPENPDVFGDPDPDNSSGQASPGYIDDYINNYNLTVSLSPELASRTTATSLGAIGISVSGAPIFNDSEGPVDVTLQVIQGFDSNGGHTGPETYHYHLEPKAISFDDDSLVGVISDGFLIYGRKCNTIGDYPTDLDASGGHTGFTQHTGTEEEYHYHVVNETYLNDYYLLFAGDYQGTPNAFD